MLVEQEADIHVVSATTIGLDAKACLHICPCSVELTHVALGNCTLPAVADARLSRSYHPDKVPRPDKNATPGLARLQPSGVRLIGPGQ